MAAGGGAITAGGGSASKGVLEKAAGPALHLALLLTAGLLFTVLLGWLLGFGVESTSDSGVVFLDASVAEELSEIRDPSTTKAMKAVTWLGNRGVVLAAMALACAALWAARRAWGAASFLAASVLGGYVASHLVKDLVHRVRPAEGLVFASGGSFPSGHAVASVTLYAGLAMVVWRLAGPPDRTVSAERRGGRAYGLMAWGLAVTLILGIGASRVYLGVHWATDVAGGAALGALWMAICARTWSRFERLNRRA